MVSRIQGMKDSTLHFENKFWRTTPFLNIRPPGVNCRTSCAAYSGAKGHNTQEIPRPGVVKVGRLILAFNYIPHVQRAARVTLGIPDSLRFKVIALKTHRAWILATLPPGTDLIQPRNEVKQLLSALLWTQNRNRQPLLRRWCHPGSASWEAPV